MSRPGRDLQLALAVFAVLFAVGAWHKGFHVDEFYSWIYCRVCSWEDILAMRDTGIGHPPLFHLLLKSVQTLFPEGPARLMRLINFAVGLLSLTVLWRVLQREPHYHPGLLIGFAASAALLDGMMLSRMYGLAFLGACLTVRSGEKFARTPTLPAFLGLIATIVFALLADFNNFLLLPYWGMVLLRPLRIFKIALYGSFATLAGLWVLLASGQGERRGKGDLAWSAYAFVRYINRICFEFLNSILSFWFFETLIAALLAVVAATWMHYRRQGNSGSLADRLMLAVIAIAAFQLLAAAGIPFAAIALLMALVLVWLAGQILRHRPLDLRSVNARMALSVLGAWMILLTMQTVFWRTLISPRFLLVLMPFVLLFLQRNLPAPSLNATGAVLLVSGLLYTFSAGIGEIYPAPPPVSGPVAYQNSAALANSYLLNAHRDPRPPMLLDNSYVEKACRICVIETRTVPFDTLEAITVIGWEGLASKNLIPPEFELVGSRMSPVSTLDSWQFSFLHPIRERQFHLLEFRKKIAR